MMVVYFKFSTDAGISENLKKSYKRMQVKGSLYNGPPRISPIAKNADVNGMGHSMYGTGCKLPCASCASEPALFA